MTDWAQNPLAVSIANGVMIVIGFVMGRLSNREVYIEKPPVPPKIKVPTVPQPLKDAEEPVRKAKDKRFRS